MIILRYITLSTLNLIVVPVLILVLLYALPEALLRWAVTGKWELIV